MFHTSNRLYYPFFLLRSRDHRDLHSFPTRRSSDLEDTMHRLGLRAGGTSPGTRSGPQPAHGRRDRPDEASCFRMPFAVAAFGWRRASRKPNPRELAQALLELFLQLVQLRARLRDLALRLVLHF